MHLTLFCALADEDKWFEEALKLRVQNEVPWIWDWFGEDEQLWLWLHSNLGLDCSVCWPFLSTMASSPLSGLLSLLDLVLVCSNSEFGRSTPDDYSRLISLIHMFIKGDDSRGDR
jgi:hypothetical protein